MRELSLCLSTAVLASLLTLWWMEAPPGTDGAAFAQPSDGPVLPAPGATPPRPQPAAPAADGLTPDERVNVAVYEKTNRSVVNISTLSVRPDRWLLRAIPSEGNGSGSVLDESGHILTNYHVVQDARQVVVTLHNGESYPAKLVGADPINDIAVIKVEAPTEELVPIAIGDSDNLQVGLRVFALGNPFGLQRTMSTGIIASLNRSLEVHENWVIKQIIQIDASINPGSSGGPLLDSRGRLIGMNTAIASSGDVRQSAGIGFAIPVNLVRRVVPELIQHGRVIRGDIGITHVTETDKGLRIARLDPDGPAKAAGLREPKITRTRRGPIVMESIDRNYADIISAIDGKKVVTAADFMEQIESRKPGEVVELTILREGRTLSIQITLAGDQPAPRGRSQRETPV
jgi:S1-C subfamily serine protease